MSIISKSNSYVTGFIDTFGPNVSIESILAFCLPEMDLSEPLAASQHPRTWHGKQKILRCVFQ